MMDAAERSLLADSVRSALDDAADADAALAGVGWPDMLSTEPDDAIAIVFAALGRTCGTASAIDDVVAHALGASHRARSAVLIPTVLVRARASGSAGEIAGVATSRVLVADELLTLCDGTACSMAVGDAEVEPLGGIDPDARLHSVRADRTSLSQVGREGAAADAVALSQRAIAHQISGACRTMLDLAREHALTRVQFGRPVARFQAVRHRLAEALVAVEALDAVLDAARDAPGVLTAQLAKAHAGRTARSVSAHCQQVLAGFGFTTEHPFHRYLKRTMLLDTLFGSSDDLLVGIGHTLLAQRAVPTLIEL
ncbi:MAG TPA: acyl-CoA dehydrogenase family protein [Acidimicrobiia bacterium]|jgi:hypothetical protein